MASDNTPPDITIDFQQWSGFFDELQSESDRGATILAAVWIENLLELKFKKLFVKSNSKARLKLFDLNGPFDSFSSKILAAYRLGWIDSDIYHDINLVREIRNKFAHELHGINLESPEFRERVDKFKIGYRYFHDWDETRAYELPDGKGFTMYTSPPTDEELGEPLNIQGLKYNLVVGLLIAEVCESLGVGIKVEGISTSLVSESQDQAQFHAQIFQGVRGWVERKMTLISQR